MAQDTSSSHSTPYKLYPGLGLPKRVTYPTDVPFYPIGAHGSCHESLSELVSVRELAMMDVMEKLTDKENWHQKVFDEDIVSKWRKEALAISDDYFWGLSFSGKQPGWLDDDGLPREEAPLDRRIENIMDETTFQACIEELRSKAKYFESTGIIPTLDASATVAKSDSLVPAELHEDLRMAFDKLKADHAACPDWHPNSNDMVQDLVHPSMYPLVYGRSRGFQAECVGVIDAITHWAGKGALVPKYQDDSAEAKGASTRYRYDRRERVPPEFWSDTYQWLPANVALREDGTVKFTSYINNLHPTKYPEIYRTIEKLIEISLPMWDQCLRIEDYQGVRVGAGRLNTRLGTPKNPSDEQPHNWIPDDIYAYEDADVDVSEIENRNYTDKKRRELIAEFKWEKFRKPKVPAIPFKEVDYTPKPGKRLAERFVASGLQIIVKMASIELTPDKPEFPVGGWHVEGQMNECICATALYYLDSDNITDTSLSFRMQTPDDLEGSDDFNVRQDSYSWLEQIYGTLLGQGNANCLQNYGSVQTRQGRLLAFPNVLQHRVSSFKLADPTKPGHRRFIALWLVDPNKRIISTANIPPQQMSWYVEELLGSDTSARKEAFEKLSPDLVELLAQAAGLPGVISDRDCHLPQELRDFVRDYINEDKSAFPMSVEEANEHRLKLMKERTGFVKNIEEETSNFTYNFCEH